MAKFKGLRPGYVGRIDSSVPVVEADEKVPPQVQQAFESAMNGIFPSIPSTIAGLRDALGGTKQAAAVVRIKGKQGVRQGVTPRTIQRYIAAEEHRTSQARRASAAAHSDIVRQLRAAVEPKWRRALESKIKRAGMRIRALGTLRIGTYHEGRFVSVPLPGVAWKEILKAWNAGDKDAAAEAFQTWFGRAYGRAGGRTKGGEKRREDFSWGYLQELTFEPPSLL